jgi:hypothetical protein
MVFIWGTIQSLTIAQLCNVGIVTQLYKSDKDKLHMENVIVSVIIGAYLADLHIGIVHYILDNCKHTNPIQTRISTGHHKHPTAILDESLIDLFTATSISPNNAICLLYNTTSYTSSSQIISQLSFLVGTSLCQVTHQLSHFVNHASKKDKTRFKYKVVKYLQDCNIILTPKIHRVHHQKHDRNFCILNGWANPLLNYIVYSLGKTTKQINNNK